MFFCMFLPATVNTDSDDTDSDDQEPHSLPVLSLVQHLSSQDSKTLVDTEKRQAIVKELRRLRQSNPCPPMVSRLDLQEDEELGAGPVNPSSPAPSASGAATEAQLARLEVEVVELRRDIQRISGCPASPGPSIARSSLPPVLDEGLHRKVNFLGKFSKLQVFNCFVLLACLLCAPVLCCSCECLIVYACAACLCCLFVLYAAVYVFLL